MNWDAIGALAELAGAVESEETMISLRGTLGNAGARHWWDEYKSLFKAPMQKLVQELYVV